MVNRPAVKRLRGYDLAQMLQGEAGKFLVTSPLGDTFVTECLPGHSITSITPTEPGQEWTAVLIAQVEGALSPRAAKGPAPST